MQSINNNIYVCTLYIHSTITNFDELCDLDPRIRFVNFVIFELINRVFISSDFFTYDILVILSIVMWISRHFFYLDPYPDPFHKADSDPGGRNWTITVLLNGWNYMAWPLSPSDHWMLNYWLEHRRGRYIFTGNSKGKILIVDSKSLEQKVCFRVTQTAAANNAVKVTILDELRWQKSSYTGENIVWYHPPPPPPLFFLLKKI